MQKQYATFFVGEDLFGIDVLLVREINRNLEVTPVDQVPDFVYGLLNLRGQIVTLVDLGVQLGLGKTTTSADTCCIVLKTNQELEKYKSEGFDTEETSNDIVGLLVDRIGDMVSADDSAIEPPPANANGIDSRFFDGVIKLERELLVILKIESVLKVESV